MNKSQKIQREMTKTLKIFTQRKKCIEKYRVALQKQREKDQKGKTVKAKKPKEEKEKKIKEPKAKKKSDSLEKI